MVAVQYKITNAFMFPLEVRHQQQPATDDSENFSVASFLENAGMLDESPFNREEMIQKYRIDWTHLPQLQDLFKDAPFDEMEQSLTP